MSRNINSLVSRLSRLAVSPPSPAARQTVSALLLKHTTTALASRTTPMTTTTMTRAFSAASVQAAKAAPAKGGKAGAKGGKAGKAGGKRKGKGGDLPDPRIRNLKVSTPRKVPAPLRFGRNRHLRHWTIHRAWMLWLRKEREREERELMRMYQSMHSACEELRKTSGPGTLDEGYLYRVAMEKKGLFSHNAIPIEYTRAQTETPARTPWNHDWTR